MGVTTSALRTKGAPFPWPTPCFISVQISVIACRVFPRPMASARMHPAYPDSLATVHDTSLVVANVDGTLLAYRNSCASCDSALDRGAFAGGALSCPGCGRSYFLPQAGRSMDDEHLQLQPVPLLREDEGIKVAL